MTAVIIPFGKHKDKTVEEVMALDPQYLRFLEQQEWMREKFPAILAAAAALGGEKHESTPEHNALQIKFLNRDFRLRFLGLLVEGFIHETEVEFEATEGWDVFLYSGTWSNEGYHRYSLDLDEDDSLRAGEPSDCEDHIDRRTGRLIGFHKALEMYRADKPSVRCFFTDEWSGGKDYCLIPNLRREAVAVEIKTWIGDEFPSILRQINRQVDRHIRRDRAGDVKSWFDGQKVLFTKGINTSAVSPDEVRAFFAQNGVRVLLLDEVEQAPLRFFVPKKPRRRA